MWQQAVKQLQPYQAVVFDLDGTLVVLRMDWREAHREMAKFAAEELGRDFSKMTVWDMLRATKGEDREGLEGVLRRREEEGALRATRLPLADLLPHLTGPRKGVVSLNSRSSCQIALENAGLSEFVDALVSREDSRRMKPNPEPLLRCLEILGSAPEATVFIGDRERDRITARRAGTSFISAKVLKRHAEGSRS